MTTLVVAPHFDDAEIGASMYLRPGAAVLVIAGQDSARLAEQQQALDTLGVDNLTWYVDWDDGEVPHNVAVVSAIEETIRKVSAHTVVSPPILDSHQDHAAVARSCLSAVRRSPVTLVEYETPSVFPEWVPNRFWEMEYADLREQVEAISAYGSQAHRAYMSRNWLEVRAEFRGQQVGVDYAQAYRVVRETRRVLE
ncbi:glucosaminyl deacetylase [Mycobacterium phage Rich]|uniref:Glucosaminyl deacetylase n=1 Tax=Mycobacterium phage Rich TaxID=1927021 RepID=A0A1L6BYV0_9CAUD|nr:glucosaminyl deacetylase [Mycobacterium phage Rich]